MKKSTEAFLTIEGEILANTATLEMSGKPVLSCSDVLIDGSFPGWRHVMPIVDINKPMVGATFNAKYLGDFASLSPNRKEAFACPYGNERYAPFLVKVWGREDLFGVLMAVPRERTEPEYPKWIGTEVIKRCFTPLKSADKAA